MPKCPALFLLALLFPVTWGMAQTSLEVSRGWGGRERAGRWNPIFVRASDRSPRDVMIDLISATEGGFGSVITEHAAIGPSKGTFALYAPSHYTPASQGVLVLRDADTGRAIAQSPSQLSRAATQPSQIGPNGIFIGIGSQPAGLEGVRLAGLADAGYLPQRLLPRSPIGYDGIEVLFLNRPDLDALEPQQQRAILDWVRAGGSLLLTPSEQPVPGGSALLAALPCKIGDIEVIGLPAGVLKQWEMPTRFAQVTARRLTPTADGHALELLAGTRIVGYWGRYGIGRILVSPLDLASLDFDPAKLKEKSAALWRPILAALTGEPPPEPKRQYDTPFYGYQSETEDQQREGAAVGTVCDFVAGPVAPSPHRVPPVLLAIFLVIGPIDSFVLFALGRRPWTWTTAAGWVALLTAAVAIALPHVRPTQAQCRSVRLIDQVDDATVAKTDLVGISSLHGDIFIGNENALGGRWWQPAIPGLIGPQGVGAQSDVVFHQSDSANQTRRMEVAPGEARFLRADEIGSDPPILKASLALRRREQAMIVVGTVQNVSAHPLTNIRIRTKLGVIRPAGDQTLMPGQVLDVNTPAAGEAFAPQKPESQYQGFSTFGSRHLDHTLAEADLWEVASDLSGRRSLRTDDYVDRLGGFCCVYAQLGDPGPVLMTNGGPPGEQAFCCVRALAPLRQ